MIKTALLTNIQTEKKVQKNILITPEKKKKKKAHQDNTAYYLVKGYPFQLCVRREYTG